MEPEKTETDNVDIINWLFGALMAGTAIYVGFLIFQKAGLWGLR